MELRPGNVANKTEEFNGSQLVYRSEVNRIYPGYGVSKVSGTGTQAAVSSRNWWLLLEDVQTSVFEYDGSSWTAGTGALPGAREVLCGTAGTLTAWISFWWLALQGPFSSTSNSTFTI